MRQIFSQKDEIAIREFLQIQKKMFRIKTSGKKTIYLGPLFSLYSMLEWKGFLFGLDEMKTSIYFLFYFINQTRWNLENSQVHLNLNFAFEKICTFQKRSVLKRKLQFALGPTFFKIRDKKSEPP